MGTIAADEIQTGEIHSGAGSSSITIGAPVFPASDSTPRSVASFGPTTSFASTSTYQSVTTTSAAVDPATTVVGVDFGGPVELVLPDVSSVDEIRVVDEGGSCSPVNTITVTSPGALGSLVLSIPYSHLRIRTTSAGVYFSEVRDLRNTLL
ncbi:unnamed protein product [Ectocarpus sp. 12 AP-2014]